MSEIREEVQDGVQVMGNYPSGTDSAAYSQYLQDKAEEAAFTPSDAVVAEIEANDATLAEISRMMAAEAPEAPAPLLPCPFCGGRAELEGGDDMHRWTVDCAQWLDDGKDPEYACKCGIGYHDTEAEARRVWNHREPDYQALVQELTTRLSRFIFEVSWSKKDAAALAHARDIGVML
jgi:hypothetical protein